MNEPFDSSERSTTEIVQFAIVCVGVFVSIAGVVMASIPAATVGGLLITFGLVYFLLRR